MAIACCQLTVFPETKIFKHFHGQLALMFDERLEHTKISASSAEVEASVSKA